MNNNNFTPLPNTFEYIDILNNKINEKYKNIIYKNILSLLNDNEKIIEYKIDFKKNKLSDIFVLFQFVCKTKNIDDLINRIGLYFEDTPFKFNKNISCKKYKIYYVVKIVKYELVD